MVQSIFTIFFLIYFRFVVNINDFFTVQVTAGQGQVEDSLTIILFEFMQTSHDYIHDFFYLFFLFFCLMAVACVLLFYGSVKCEVEVIIVYVPLETVRLVMVTWFYLKEVKAIKNYTKNVNPLIIFVVIGEFILILLWYMLACVLSLVYYIYANRKKVGSKRIDDVVLGHNYYLKSDVSVAPKVTDKLGIRQPTEAWARYISKQKKVTA